MAVEWIETTCADCEERFDTPTDRDGCPVWITCERCRQKYRITVGDLVGASPVEPVRKETR